MAKYWCAVAMISGATWAAGELHPRQDEWLATGDIAEQQESGELRFLGRKSEVIVTAAGLNIHPEDIEAAIEEQPEIAACAVVAMETPTRSGAMRGTGLPRLRRASARRHRARQREAGRVSAHQPLGAVAGARSAAHVNRKSAAQARGRMAGPHSSRCGDPQRWCFAHDHG